MKIELGSAFPLPQRMTREVKGRDLLTGVPKVIILNDDEIREALSEPVATILDTVKVALEHTPPELAADIMERGIVLTGGGSLLRGLDQLISQETGLPVSLAEDALAAIALGSGKVLDELELLKKVAV